jgi:hypothetical protein
MMHHLLTPAMRAFLAEPHFATLGTTSSDGSPHLTVMWYALEGDELLLNTPTHSRKIANLRRLPRAGLMIEAGYRYLALYGGVRLLEDQATTQADILRLAIRYCGEEDGQRRARQEYLQQQRVSIRLTIERLNQIGFSQAN